MDEKGITQAQLRKAACGIDDSIFLGTHHMNKNKVARLEWLRIALDGV